MIIRKPKSWNEVLESVRCNKSIRIYNKNYGAKVVYDKFSEEVLIELDDCFEETFYKIAEHNFNNRIIQIEIYEYKKEEPYSRLCLNKTQNSYLCEILNNAYADNRIYMKLHKDEMDEDEKNQMLEEMEHAYLILRVLEEKTRIKIKGGEYRI